MGGGPEDKTPTGGVRGRVGDLRAAVAVGGGLGVGVDLNGLELLGNPRSFSKIDREIEMERRWGVRQSNYKWMRLQ